MLLEKHVKELQQQLEAMQQNYAEENQRYELAQQELNRKVTLVKVRCCTHVAKRKDACRIWRVKWRGRRRAGRNCKRRRSCSNRRSAPPTVISRASRTCT